MGLPDVNLTMRKKRKRRTRRRRGRGREPWRQDRAVLGLWAGFPFVLPCDVVALSPLGSSVLTGAPVCLSGFAPLDVLRTLVGLMI